MDLFEKIGEMFGAGYDVINKDEGVSVKVSGDEEYTVQHEDGTQETLELDMEYYKDIGFEEPEEVVKYLENSMDYALKQVGESFSYEKVMSAVKEKKTYAYDLDVETVEKRNLDALKLALAMDKIESLDDFFEKYCN